MGIDSDGLERSKYIHGILEHYLHEGNMPPNNSYNETVMEREYEGLHVMIVSILKASGWRQ